MTHAEVEREQRDGRRRQDAGDDGVAAGGGDPARERVLELGAGGARVAADEDPAAPDQRVAARPSRSTSSGVISSPTTPRTPSVPK